jgi:hypothetical protein
MADPDRNRDPHRPPHPNAPPRRMTEGGGGGRRIGIIVAVLLAVGVVGWLIFGGTVPQDDTLGEPAGFGVAAPEDAEPGQTVGPGETHAEDDDAPATPFTDDDAAGTGEDATATPDQQPD